MGVLYVTVKLLIFHNQNVLQDFLWKQVNLNSLFNSRGGVAETSWRASQSQKVREGF